MRLLPASLLGRVYALYAITLGTLAMGMLVAFVGLTVRSAVLEMHHDAETAFEMTTPVLAESLVVGDDDGVKRHLNRLVSGSAIARARFVDGQGGVLEHGEMAQTPWVPPALQAWLRGMLGEVSHRVVVGGKDYGQLTLVLDTGPMAQRLVQQVLASLALGLVALVLGLWLTRRYLIQWLGHLDRMVDLGTQLEGGASEANRAGLARDAPAEFRHAFEALSRAAGSMQAQREMATATLESIHDAVLNCDIDGNIHLVNKAAGQLFQTQPEALLGEPVTALVPALEAPSLVRAMQTGWTNRRLEWRDPDGRERVLETNLSPISSARGERLGQVLAFRDVTEADQRELAILELNTERDSALAQLRGALEQVHGSAPDEGGALADIAAVSLLVTRLLAALQERSAKLDAIFNLSPDGFVSFDGEGVVRYVSPGFTGLTGLNADSVLGAEENVFLHHMRGRLEGGPKLHALSDLAGAGMGALPPLKLAKGRGRYLAAALHRSDSQAVAYILHLRDVSRETEMDRLKSEFLATAAHELRTPMVGIFGYSELLLSREMPPTKQKLLFERIYRQSQVMLNILNEMLDLARLEAGGRSELALSESDLDTAVTAMMLDYACPVNREPPVWISDGCSVQVVMDTGKVARALRNLLSNAYKYSSVGQPVTVRRIFNANMVGVQIEDLGTGLTPEQLARVGERFYRADESGTVLGTGLGVSLVKEIAQLHGGFLELQSTLGEGTAATLWLPLKEAPTEPAHRADAQVQLAEA